MRVQAATTTHVRILPNACVDIVVYCGETARGDGSAAIVAPPYRSFVVGSTLRSFIVRSVGWNHIVGVSLLPAGVEPILGVPARVIGEHLALLADVIGARAAELEERVIDGDPTRSLARLTDELVRLRRSRHGNAVVTKTVRALREAGGTARIDAVASAANLSTRHLERHFLEHVGISPKVFARLVRFDRAARGIPSRGARSWSEFALAHGYSDQAHFINDFKEFAGITPTQFEVEVRQ